MYFIILCLLVKPVTTELTENKTALKFCKLQNTRTDWSLRNVKMTIGRFSHNTYENYAHYLGTTNAKIGFPCAARRVNVCGNVCVDMANVWRLACVVLDDDDRQTKAFRKHWSKQLGILLACITTTFGRSGSRRSQRRNLNWAVNWTSNRTPSLKENSRWATTNFASWGCHSVELFFWCEINGFGEIGGCLIRIGLCVKQRSYVFSVWIFRMRKRAQCVSGLIRNSMKSNVQQNLMAT